jgi:A/G-specific adenine glycosylase
MFLTVRPHKTLVNSDFFDPIVFEKRDRTSPLTLRKIRHAGSGMCQMWQPGVVPRRKTLPVQDERGRCLRDAPTMKALSAREKPVFIPPLQPEERRAFARLLMAWYRRNARILPWRGVRDPYRTWLSEIMLQQTRVTAVIDHYTRFLRRFPTLVSLALAPEEDVLALWSGLGYYRRARMLHRAAQLLVREYGGTLPATATELRRLPGIGVYTSAAIASIAFGERIAVVDGNVERVLLRILGQPATPGVRAAEQLNEVAQKLIPARNPGDHNQAMMELGATVCLPRGPLCGACPVYAYCRTRGEHPTMPRARMRSERASFALCTRKTTAAGLEVLLQRRPGSASLMAGMLELPQLSAPSEDGFALTEQPVLRLRHAITGTNYYVEVYGIHQRRNVTRRALRKDGYEWVRTTGLARQPITGLARKVLQRMRLMKSTVDEPLRDLPLIIGRETRMAAD